VIRLVSLVTAVRVASRAEGFGLDVAEHGEEAYASGEGALLILPAAPAVPARGPVGVRLAAEGRDA
jgi:Amt family ammonium transporter